jgi:hypothetical protein
MVVRHFERLGGQWQSVLQESVYARLVGHLLEEVLREVLQPLLSAECIGEEAGADIARIFRTLQRARLTLPGDFVSDDARMADVCPSWRKFVSLGDLLEYSLNEVAEWLPKKKFARFGFGGGVLCRC